MGAKRRRFRVGRKDSVAKADNTTEPKGVEFDPEAIHGKVL